jgi:hypothetical protein
VGDGPVWSTVSHSPWDSPILSTGPYGTNLHNLILGEERTGPPLDRTKVRHKTDTYSATVRSDPVHGPKQIGLTDPFQYSSFYARLRPFFFLPMSLMHILVVESEECSFFRITFRSPRAVSSLYITFSTGASWGRTLWYWI